MSEALAPPWPVWADGRLHPAGTPVIEAEDQGFLLGLAVFDTVLLEHRTVFFLEEHVGRLRRGAAELGLPWPPPWRPGDALHELARALGESTAALRLTLSLGVPGKGTTMTVTPRPVVPPPAEGIRVFVSSRRKLGTEALESVKSTNRMRNVLARAEAEAHGAWEALLANPEGDLSEGTVSNLFVVQGGALRTPSAERGSLLGITREKILGSVEREPVRGTDGRALEVVVDRVDPEHVYAADEVFLTNTTGRVIGVLEVGGLSRAVRGLPGPAGPVARELRARMAALEETYRVSRAL